MEFKITKGPAASNTYVTFQDREIATLTLDWSYNSIYFKYDQEAWISIELGGSLDIIDTDEKKKLFKKLAEFTMVELKNYSTVSNNALESLKEMLNKL